MSEPQSPGTSSLQRRFLTWFSILLVVLLVVIGVLIQGGVRDVLVQQLAGTLEDQARLVALVVDRNDPDLQDIVADQGAAIGARITLILTDGTVIADTEADPATMDDHSGRPEVIEAIAGGVAVSRRFSDTTSVSRMYVALPPQDDVIVRLSVTEETIAAEIGALSERLIPTLVVVGLVGVIAISVLSTRLVRPISELTDIAANVAEGRLEVRPRRSTVKELDELGVAIGHMASELGRRILEIEEERQTMEAVLGALPQGVILVEDDDRISYANPVARRLLGEIPDRVGGLVPTPLQRLVRESRERQALASIDLEPGNPSRTLRSLATPFHGDDGRVLLAIEDVTERQRIESIRRDFVADASHELKTPVASILASMEAMQLALERDPERALGFAVQVEASARRLARIVEDLLDLSRLEASSDSWSHIDLAEIVTEEVERLKIRAGERGVPIDIDVVAAPTVGNASDLALAVRNLGENAIRYTDRGGTVSFTLRRFNREFELAVSDTGTGIPTRALARVFERFYRVDVARSRDTGGTGLGLAIVKHVAERHGGSVSVESELGAGSTFRMRLPAADAD